MILSDAAIRLNVAERNLVIEPFDDTAVQPASYDVRLSDHFLRFLPSTDLVDPRLDDITAHMTPVRLDREGVRGGLRLEPQEMLLGSTVEYVEIPSSMVARLEGRSTYARLGLAIHTAGYIDPGFRGTITLEISNHGPRPVLLRPNDRIGQLSFAWLDAPAERPYGHPDLGSKYHGQRAAQAARQDREWRGE